jgi:hypothetical protein
VRRGGESVHGAAPVSLARRQALPTLILILILNPEPGASTMATYILLFSADGQQHEDFTVPPDKVVYLVRAQAVSAGTATVRDLNTQHDYVIPDGVTVYRTSIKAGQEVSLAFVARTNDAIVFVNAEVVSPREQPAAIEQ